ncbi:MAG TPA: MarR family transcriptional regulator [Gaiellaceae bacterium]|nr:MarR family transcriptional regulator [Gaiellaceae bacterium]
MAVALSHDISAAREAQRLFFEIGMVERARVAKALGKLGLTFVQAHALRTLDPERPLAMSALAELLVCDASNVTGIADRLELRGLIERRSADGDRRVKALALTQKGIALRRRVLDVMSEPPASIAALSEADQRDLRDILRRAVELLRSDGAS